MLHPFKLEAFSVQVKPYTPSCTPNYTPSQYLALNSGLRPHIYWTVANILDAILLCVKGLESGAKI